jgi:DNA-binding beta-propeller fold protein YncE
MATETPPITEVPAGTPDEERGTRRLLTVLLVVLLLAAIALLALLFWLLRPEPRAAPSGPPGYPIRVVATVYGFGERPEELLRFPMGVAFDGMGNVWISNQGQSRVEQYTREGMFIRMVGHEPGPGRLAAPYGLAVDPARGRLYVADTAAGLIQVYTTDGAYVGHLPADDQDLGVFGPSGFTPYDVTIHEGRIIASSNDGLYFFSQEGRVVARWGATVDGENVRGSAMGAFNFPDALVVDPEDGTIYVADSGNRRVVAVDRNGFWRWVSGAPDEEGKIRSFWQLPRGIELGADGNLYVVDTFRFDPEGMGTGHLVVLSRNGKLISEFGRAGVEDGAFNYPEHLAATPDGGLWAIADRENHRVVLFELVPPYPEVDDLLAERYPKTFVRPDYVWVTPPPLTPEQEALLEEQRSDAKERTPA